MSYSIGIVGAGRMGLGIALSYAYAGHTALLLDLKQRSDSEREQLLGSARAALSKDLDLLAEAGLMDAAASSKVLDRISIRAADSDGGGLIECPIVYEAVPERLDAKTEAFDYISKYASDDAIIASTTSSFLVSVLAPLVVNRGRYLNAHWLNPAHLMPLVEIGRGGETEQSTVDALVESLESIGKVPVVCADSPGYIVPRIQSLAMNEAARLVEEGVASAEDVDKAINVGFGLRYAVLGVLEFIDWGGGDILHYASKNMAETIDPRFASPDIVGENMREGRNGLRDGEGFFDYRGMDIDAYRNRRLKDFIALLSHNNLLPTHR